jgi:hypothetical protein
MMQAPDIGGMIFEHTADAHALELPFVGHVALPQWAPVHVGGMAIDLSPTKHVVFLLVAAFLVWLTMWLTGRALERQRAQGSGAPRGVASAIEAMVLFVRNDVAIANIGRRGASFAPYILTLFWLILYSNLLGLIPFGATATGNLAVTGALALTALVTIEVSGMVALGPKGYAKTIVFVPPGTTGVTDHDPRRTHREDRQAVRAHAAALREHDRGALRHPLADGDDLHLRAPQLRPLGDRGGLGGVHAVHVRAGTVRGVPPGVHLRAPRERVHRPHAARALGL